MRVIVAETLTQPPRSFSVMLKPAQWLEASTRAFLIVRDPSRGLIFGLWWLGTQRKTSEFMFENDDSFTPMGYVDHTLRWLLDDPPAVDVSSELKEQLLNDLLELNCLQTSHFQPMMPQVYLWLEFINCLETSSGRFLVIDPWDQLPTANEDGHPWLIRLRERNDYFLANPGQALHYWSLCNPTVLEKVKPQRNCSECSYIHGWCDICVTTAMKHLQQSTNNEWEFQCFKSGYALGYLAYSKPHSFA